MHFVPKTSAALVPTRPVPESRPSGENDASLTEVWLGSKVSSHTRRAYRSEIERFRQAVAKPLARVTMADLQEYAEQLGVKTLVFKGGES